LAPVGPLRVADTLSWRGRAAPAVAVPHTLAVALVVVTNEVLGAVVACIDAFTWETGLATLIASFVADRVLGAV